MTKIEMLGDSLIEIRKSIDALQNEMDDQIKTDGHEHRETYRAWCDALLMEREMLNLIKKERLS